MKEFFIQVLRFLKLDELLLGLFEKIRLGLMKKFHKARGVLQEAKGAISDTFDNAQSVLEDTQELAQDALECAQEAVENFLG